MQWDARGYQGWTDHYATGWVIVEQTTGGYALYSTYSNSDVSDGRCHKIGTLDECKQHAEQENQKKS